MTGVRCPAFRPLAPKPTCECIQPFVTPCTCAVDTSENGFQIICEAAGELSPTTRGLSDAPWKRVVAFRNRLIHGYWSVDVMLVWDVIENELPPLKTEVARLIAELRDKTDQ